MAGNAHKGKNLQNQQDLNQQNKAGSQYAEFSSSMPETDEEDIEFIPSKQLEEQVEES